MINPGGRLRLCIATSVGFGRHEPAPCPNLESSLCSQDDTHEPCPLTNTSLTSSHPNRSQLENEYQKAFS